MARKTSSSYGNRSSRGGRPSRGNRPGRGGNAQGRKKRVCRFCENKDTYVDYKNDKKLQRFVSEQGRIIPRRITGTCSRHQRMLVQAIKRARHLALLPYAADAVR